jgi:hypothetical protein
LAKLTILHLRLVKGTDESFVVNLKLLQLLGFNGPEFPELAELLSDPFLAFGDLLTFSHPFIELVLEVDMPLGKRVAREFGLRARERRQ